LSRARHMDGADVAAISETIPRIIRRITVSPEATRVLYVVHAAAFDNERDARAARPQRLSTT
jgi:hypothetical protein